MRHLKPKFILILFLLSVVSRSLSAQINVTSNVTAAQLVANLVGTGITFSNPTLVCDSLGAGEYTVVSTNLGLGDGVVLTTGYARTDPAATPPIAGVNGAQTAFFPANCVGLENDGDSALTALAQNQTYDKCILEFDFIPDGDSLLFDYVFGSEEYDAFSCTGFNDVFAFFLSGPGIVGTPNIALIPGTNIPVAINSTTNPAVTQPSGLGPCQAMGPGSPFAQYYNDNSAGTSITYYGLTTVLTARAAVIPCTTYHIKLAIADAGDCTLDSGVFLEANSFRSSNIKLNLASSLGSKYDYLVEGCTQATVTVKRSTPFPIPQTVKLGYGGAAIRDVDYTTVPDSVIIPSSDTVVSFTFSPIQDNVEEGVDSIWIRVLNPCTGVPIDSVSFRIFDYLPYDFLSVDTALCQGDSVRLQVEGDTDFTWYWRSDPESMIRDAGAILTWSFPDTTTTYFVSATFQGCVTDTSSFTAQVEPIPLPNILFEDTTLCFKNPLKLPVDVKPYYFTNYLYSWSPGIGLTDSTAKEPYFFPPKPDTYHLTLTVRTPLGCSNFDTVLLIAKPGVQLENVTGDFTVKYGSQAQLNAEGALYYIWTPDRMLDFPYTNDPKVVAAVDSATFMVIGMNVWGCRDTAYVHMDIDYGMFEILPSAFSPNSDGLNDVFSIRHLKFQRLVEFRIFNRWGQELFNTVDPNRGWDGTFKGVPQDVGVYQYLIRVTIPDGTIKTFKGNVTLVR